jgi:hypothetical protein
MMLWPFVLAPTLLVTSAPDCPSAGAIDARVREILGLPASRAIDEQAMVAREGGSLKVTLRTKDGRAIGERSLQADGTCGELAGVVAVVLSAWLSDVHPEFVASLPEAAPPPPPEPRAPIAPAPPRPPPEVPRETRATGALSHHGAFAAAVGADLLAQAPAPLAMLGFRWMPEKSGLGAAAAVTIIGARTEPLLSGSVRYWRWPLSIGPAWRMASEVASVDIAAGPALAWLHLEGRDFSLSATRDTPVVGGTISTRISLGADTLNPFAEVTGVWWPSSQAFVQRGAQQLAVDLPAFELYVVIGASLRAW